MVKVEKLATLEDGRLLVAVGWIDLLWLRECERVYTKKRAKRWRKQMHRVNDTLDACIRADASCKS